MLFGLSAGLPARAQIGAPYSVIGFKPYLERGYNTRLGWQGWPVTAEDPHLYLYSQDNLRLLTEMEYLRANGLIQTQIFKVYQPAGQLGAQEWAELEYFALESSRNRVGSDELHAMVARDCKGEWRLADGLYLSLIPDTGATWLRVSSSGSAGAQPWKDCLARRVLAK